MAAPLAFTTVASATSDTQVNLAWQPGDSTETGYTIQRSTTGNPNNDPDWHAVLNPGATATTAVDTTCQPATTYYYRICAVSRGGSSAWVYANAVTTLAPPAPAAPSQLTAVGVSSSQIDLSWTDNSVNAPGGGQATGFQIQRHIGPAGTGTYDSGTSVAALPTTYADTGLTPNTTYTYRVRATNAGGYSAFSNEATAITVGSNTGGGAPPNGIYLSQLVVGNVSGQGSLSPVQGMRDSGHLTGIVRISAAASTDILVNLTSNQQGVVSTVSGVTIPAGSTTAYFSIAGVPGSAPSSGISTTIKAQSGNWIQSQKLMVVPGTMPLAVSSVTAAPGESMNLVFWQPLPEGSVQGYNIYRTSNGTRQKVNPFLVPGDTYADNGLNDGSAYTYDVTAVDWNGNEASSSVTAASTPAAGAALQWAVAPSSMLSGMVSFQASTNTGDPVSTITLLVDGQEAGSGGFTPSGSGGTGPNYPSVSYDTSNLTSGSHTFQLITWFDGQTVGATTPVTSLVANAANGVHMDDVLQPQQGEVGAFQAQLPSGTATWTASISDIDTGSVVRSWQGTGTYAAASWDGTDSTGAALPDNSYTVSVSSYDASGNANSTFNCPLELATQSPACLALVNSNTNDRNPPPTNDRAVTAAIRHAFASSGYPYKVLESSSRRQSTELCGLISMWMRTTVHNFCFTPGHGNPFTGAYGTGSYVPPFVGWGSIKLYASSFTAGSQSSFAGIMTPEHLSCL